nr:BTB/POZ domain-containing protein At1g55760 [Ipomoea batatas]
MTEDPYRVDTTSRFAQWRFENLPTCTYRRSQPFIMGKWNWILVVENNRSLSVKFHPETSNTTRDNPPIASFIIRLVSNNVGPDRKVLVHPEVIDKKFKYSETTFLWTIQAPISGKFIIDIEFLDLKIESPNKGDELCSIWAETFKREESNAHSLSSLSTMFSKTILTDIVINASDGSIEAHRAVLAARSPVFHTMFSSDLKEKEVSTVDISDMSVESCRILVSYMYGSIKNDDFVAHRLELLRAADKYDVGDLKEACSQSLLEDIDCKNVLERLQAAVLYELPELKLSCMQYLVKFGKVFEIRDEFTAFLQYTDRELICEMFSEILAVWKGL